MIEGVPVGNAEVVKVATPPLRGADPKAVEPTAKFTVPVGGPSVVTAGVTVAVKVTEAPGLMVALLADTLIVVAMVVGSTVSGCAAEALMLFVVSPAYTAVML